MHSSVLAAATPGAFSSLASGHEHEREHRARAQAKIPLPAIVIASPAISANFFSTLAIGQQRAVETPAGGGLFARSLYQGNRMKLVNQQKQLF
jgi:hypothetical protein